MTQDEYNELVKYRDNLMSARPTKQSAYGRQIDVIEKLLAEHDRERQHHKDMQGGFDAAD